MSKNGKPNTWNSRFFINYANYIRFATSKSNMNLKLNKYIIHVKSEIKGLTCKLFECDKLFS